MVITLGLQSCTIVFAKDFAFAIFAKGALKMLEKIFINNVQYIARLLFFLVTYIQSGGNAIQTAQQI